METYTIVTDKKRYLSSSSHDKFAIILDSFIEESGDDNEGNDDDDECLLPISSADT